MKTIINEFNIYDLVSARNAEQIISYLPNDIAHIVQCCLLVQFFDQTIIKDYLISSGYVQRDVEEKAASLYKEITSFPFINSYPSGASFHYQSRKILLEKYTVEKTEFLKRIAKMMAPLYYKRIQKLIHSGFYIYSRFAAEAIFCYILGDDVEDATVILNQILDDAICFEDWEYIKGIFQFVDSTKQFSFVPPFQYSSFHWTLRGLAYGVLNENDNAFIAYQQAIKLDSQNIQSRMLLAALQARLQLYDAALQEYDAILKIKSNDNRAYLYQGFVFLKQGKWRKAFPIVKEVLQREPENAEARDMYQLILNEIEIHKNLSGIKLDRIFVDL